MTGWVLLGLVGVLMGAGVIAVAAWVVAVYVSDWRRGRRDRRQEARAEELIRRQASQERAAAAQLTRPHGRRVVVQLADERARRRSGCNGSAVG